MNEDANDYTVYEADKLYKRKIVKPEISVAKYACSAHNKKLFYGSPNPLLVIEDLAYRFSLEELQGMFDESVQTYHELAKEMKIMPAEHPIDISSNIRDIAMKMFTDQLYGRQLTYSASLLRKCSKVYKETVITAENHLVKDLKQHAMNTDILEIEDIFPREFFEKQNYSETVKKLSIISQIFNKELLHYLHYNHGQEIQQQLFGGQFKDQLQPLISSYEKFNEPQRSRLQQLYDDDIDRLMLLPASGRMFIESLDQATERFKLKMERPYRFLANPNREGQQLFFIFQKIFEQVERNILKREQQGIDQTQTRVLLN